MRTESLNKFRSEAFMLPEAERVELAHALVKSLDAPGVRVHWKLGRREFCAVLLKLMRGTAKLIDRDEFRRRMQAQIGG